MLQRRVNRHDWLQENGIETRSQIEDIDPGRPIAENDVALLWIEARRFDDCRSRRPAAIMR